MNWKAPPTDPDKIWVNKSMELQILLLCNWSCHACFSGNTEIKMAGTGIKKISDIVVGDLVISYDEKTKTFVDKEVKRVMRRTTNSILKLKTSGWRNTFVTEDHPMLVKGKGWIKACDLVEGDILLHLSISEQKTLNNPMKDKNIAKKVSISKTGVPANLSEEGRKKISELATKRMLSNNPMKNPATAIKGFLSRKDRGKKSTSEVFIYDIGKKFGLKFVGGGDLVVGFRIPDFIIENTNKLVEVWDKSLGKFLKRNTEWKNKRRSIFEKEGYEVLFIEVDFIHDIDKEKVRVENKLSEYSRNGEIVKEITKISAEINPKAWTRLTGQLDSDLIVYNLEIEDTHTYTANSLIVHNCDQFSNMPGISFVRKATMSVRQIDCFINEMIDKNAYIGRIRVLGGEPTLHPKFQVMVEKLHKELVVSAHVGQIEIITNGSKPDIVKKVKDIAKIRVSGEAAKEKFHVANLAATPNSLGYEGKMCNAPWHCGFSLNYYGYFPCSSGAGLARMHDWMEHQRMELPIEGIKNTWPALQELCNFCYHGLREEDKVRCGTDLHHLNVPSEESWRSLSPWLNGKQPDWKVYSEPKQSSNLEKVNV